MSSKSYITYKPGFINYKRPDPFKTYAGMVQPNNRMLVDSNAFTRQQDLYKQMRKGFAQADLTAYSQGNVGSKK
jgi:hypothetical protein